MPFPGFRNRASRSNARASRSNAPSSVQLDPNNFLNQAQTLIPAEVRMISGCEDEQTSADVSNVNAGSKLPNPAGRAGGACTSALLDVLYGTQTNGHYQQQNLTFQEVLVRLRQSLSQQGFSQIPQLTSSRPLDVKDTPFHIVGGSGRRRALLVGINYRGQDGQLRGCHNDVLNMQKYLQNVHGFPPSDMLVLIDDGQHKYPTRYNIIRALQALVTASVAGDSVFFHYSGHGGLLMPEQNFLKNKNNNFDQTLIPLDHEKSGQIRDFSLFNHFVKPMAAGVTVTCIMDCCHSGSVLDLPYSFMPTATGEMRSMMSPNMDFMMNLAFLYILAGGLLPAGQFDDVTEHFNDVTGEDMGDFQGAYEDEAAQDLVDDGGGEYDMNGYTDGDMNGYTDGGDMDGYANGGDMNGYADGDMNGYDDGNMNGYNDGNMNGYNDGNMNGYMNGDMNGDTAYTGVADDVDRGAYNGVVAGEDVQDGGIGGMDFNPYADAGDDGGGEDTCDFFSIFSDILGQVFADGGDDDF